MDKTISTKIPEEEVEIIEKIAGDRKESVSGFVRNLIRNAIEKGEGTGEERDARVEEILTILRSIEASKPDQGLSSGGGSDETKKLAEKIEILSEILPMMSDQIKKLREKIDSEYGMGGGGKQDQKILEAINQNAEKLDSLKAGGISFRVESGSNVSFKNPEFWKKSLAVTGICLILFAGVQGWGSWKIYRQGVDKAELVGIALANPVYKSFYHLMQCDQKGWKAEWSKDGKKLYCALGLNPSNGQAYELRIR